MAVGGGMDNCALTNRRFRLAWKLWVQGDSHFVQQSLVSR